MYRIEFSETLPLQMAGRFAESGGWTHNGRSLDRHILCYIVEGSCSFVIGEKHFALSAGEAVLIPQNTFYAPSTEGGCLYQYFHFRARLSQADAPLPLAQSYHYREEIPPAAAALHLPECFAVDADVAFLLETVLAEMESTAPTSNLRMNLIFLDALARIAEKCAVQPERTLARAIEQFIGDNLDRKPTLGMLCEHFGYTKQYIIRVFKRQFGQTPAAYINDLKLSRAMRYLTETDASIEKAAHRSGFDDSNYFSRQFKRKYGLSPTEYRKQSAGI